MKLPNQREIRQIKNVIVMVLPRKTCIKGSRRHASGQSSLRHQSRPIITSGSRRCAYQTLSRRSAWLNRDPLGEPWFKLMRRVGYYRTRSHIQIPSQLLTWPNLYDIVGNNPVNRIDSNGECWVQITAGVLIGVWIWEAICPHPPDPVIPPPDHTPEDPPQDNPPSCPGHVQGPTPTPPSPPPPPPEKPVEPEPPVEAP